MRPPTTCFTATRLASTTFKIVQDDVYNEQPFLYLKVFPELGVLLLIDTGCGSEAAKDRSAQLTSLRKFLETYPQPDFGPGNVFNPSGSRKYVIACTHCHYDHILAVDEFSDAIGSTVVASARGRQFVSSDLAKHSLCQAMEIPTPRYAVTQWAAHLGAIASPLDSTQGLPGITVLHVPGHTPDSLAIYDSAERALFAGDTVYEWAAVLFPPEGGNIVDWLASMRMLVGFVEEQHVAGGQKEVRIYCGHNTAGEPALEVLTSCLAFVEDVLAGKVPVKQHMNIRGHHSTLFEQPGTERFSLLATNKILDDAKRR